MHRTNDRREVRRFQTLDGMRGVAAILVALLHWRERTGETEFAGYLAVDLFFVLSGFVIALSYTKKLQIGLGALNFLRLRAIRLVPLYEMGLLLGTGKQIVGLALHDPRALQLSTLFAAFCFNALMLPDMLNPGLIYLFPINGPSWSLFFEIIVNMAFAIYIWKAPTPIIILLMISALAVLVDYTRAFPYLNVGWDWGSAPLGLCRSIYSFSAGILLFRYISFTERWVTWLSLIPVIAMAAAIIWPVGTVLRPYFELLIVGIGFPAMVIVGIKFDPPPVIGKIFGFLGDVSYPVYAIHWPLIALACPVLLKLHIPPLSVTAAFIAFLLLVGYFAAKGDEVVRAAISRRAHLRTTASLQIIQP